MEHKRRKTVGLQGNLDQVSPQLMFFLGIKSRAQEHTSERQHQSPIFWHTAPACVRAVYTHIFSLTHAHTHLLDTLPPACTRGTHTHNFSLSVSLSLLSPHRTQAVFCCLFPSAGSLGLQHSVWIAHPRAAHTWPLGSSSKCRFWILEGLEWGSGRCVSASLPESRGRCCSKDHPPSRGIP